MRYPPSHLVCLVHPLLNEDTDPDRLVIIRSRSFPKSLDKSLEGLCKIVESGISRTTLADIPWQCRWSWAPSVTKQSLNLQAQFPSLFISDLLSSICIQVKEQRRGTPSSSRFESSHSSLPGCGTWKFGIDLIIVNTPFSACPKRTVSMWLLRLTEILSIKRKVYNTCSLVQVT